MTERTHPSMLKKTLSALLVCGVLLGTPVLMSAQSAAPAASVTTPDGQAAKFYRATRDQDYKAMYYLLALTPTAKSKLPPVDQFAEDVRHGYQSSFKTPAELAKFDAIFHSISDIMVGEPVISGNTATVPTSAKITANGVTRVFHGEAHMILDEGVWKLDLTFTEDNEKAMAQREAELFGKPEAPH